MRLFTANLLILAVSLPVAASSRAADQPLAEKYLLEGRLAKGAADLAKRLQDRPHDDDARFGLGVIQFLQTFEHLGQSLYRYGLRTERPFMLAPQIHELLPQNPDPEKIDYAAARKIVQTFVDDLDRAEATLAKIEDENVKLRLHVGRIKLDLTGLKKPVNAAFILRQIGPPPGFTDDQLQELLIAFDRGDVCWFRGYCHFLAAWGEVLLAVDGKQFFDCSAHWAFEDPDTPYRFLAEDRSSMDANRAWWSDNKRLSDIIATIHLALRLPMKEPQRMKTAHGHLLSMCKMGKEMWKHYLAETGDDHKWIPNPRQKSVIGVVVTQGMVDAWLATLDEAELVLEGKRLIPFWRGQDADLGVNLKRVFYEPREIDIPLWFQGTAATPYLEHGPLTDFARPETWGRIDRAFGGFNFIGFGFWFN